MGQQRGAVAARPDERGVDAPLLLLLGLAELCAKERLPLIHAGRERRACAREFCG